MDAVADTVYAPEAALRGNVYLNVTVPVESVVPVRVVTVVPDRVIWTWTVAPVTGVPDAATVTVIMTGLPLL